MKRFIVLAALTAVGVVSSASADTLASGSATIDYDQAAWESLASGYGPTPVLTLSAFFDQTQADARTGSQLLSDPAPATNYTGEVYAMYGSSVANLSGRYGQPTTFAFTPGQLTLHTGVIGLGGVTRFDVYGGAFGSLLFGDFTLQYDSARQLVGGSGWYLKGNIAPAAAAFDLLNVNIIESPGSFTISGDLGVSYEVANFLFSTPADTLADVGNFTFTGIAAIPEPSAVALVTGGLGLLWFARKRRVA
ncbi:MAG TPA: PEP-CTERM sorting domain-containing protein [Verrucomicrobiae bacterium]|nr:PEP-CTERM sorting domain-containing protein [Verrucomicrobiae bacterium]